MSIGTIGSTPSFWQQDQSYWEQARANDSSTAATNSVINAISAAQTRLGKGLASIANKAALDRVNTQLSAAIQSILTGDTGGSSSNSTTSSSRSSGSSAAPATGIGKAALSISTPLSTLGILAGGAITVSAGGDTTTYASTGTDTVGDLMHAINADLFGNAPVTASLNKSGRLVLTAKNDTDLITVGGLYASNVGFGVGNNTFKPTKGPANAAAATPAPASTPAKSSASTAKTPKSYTTPASEMVGTAASVLADSGAGGSLVDMLA